jgi:hypothetical protein
MATKSSDELEAGVSVVSSDALGPDGELSRSAQLIRVLENIENIDLSNKSILTNQGFNRLQDYGRAIEDRLLGRSNPFAPIGTANLSNSTKTKESNPTTTSAVTPERPVAENTTNDSGEETAPDEQTFE